jgi:hypothetical protein
MQPPPSPRDEIDSTAQPAPDLREQSADGAVPSSAGIEPPVAATSAESATADRRTSLRRRKQQTVLVINPAQSEDARRGWLLDRSLGGLGLLMDQPADEGTLLRVRATNAPSRFPWVEVQVRNCRRKENSWELGCQFLRTPSWEVLLTFG